MIASIRVFYMRHLAVKKSICANHVFTSDTVLNSSFQAFASFPRSILDISPLLKILEFWQADTQFHWKGLLKCRIFPNFLG